MLSVTVVVVADDSSSIEPVDDDLEVIKSAEDMFFIYYSDDDCNLPVNILPRLTDQTNPLLGGESPNGICSDEPMCLHDDKSDFCHNELIRTANGTSYITVNEYGLVAVCDTTNDIVIHGECHLIDGCKDSSLFPNCKFQTIAESKLFQEPETILNPNVIPSEHISYMIYYSDSQCDNIVGISGVVTGEDNITITDETYTCKDAMKCLNSPDGKRCHEEINQEATSIKTIISETRNNGADVYQCDHLNDNNSCQLVTSECKQSLIPTCHSRWVSNVELFKNPLPYILNSTTLLERRQSPSSSGAADNNGGREDNNEDASSSSSSSLLPWTVLVNHLLSAAVITSLLTITANICE